MNLVVDGEYSNETRINLALAYLNLGNYDKAFSLINEIDLQSNAITFQARVNMYYTIGTLFDSLGRIDSARIYFDKSYRMTNGVNPRFTAENLLSLGRVHRKSGNLESGEQLVNSAEEIARAQEFQDVLLRCFRERIHITTLKGDLMGTIQSQENYLHQRKKFYDLNMSRITAMHKLKFRLAEQNSRLLLNQKHLKASASLAQLHNQFQTIILIVGLMVIVLIVLLIYQVNIRIKHSSVLEEAVEARMAHFHIRTKAIIEILKAREVKKRRVEWYLDRISGGLSAYSCSLFDAEIEISEPE